MNFCASVLVGLVACSQVVRILYNTLALGEMPTAEATWIIPATVLFNLIKDSTGLVMASKYRKGECSRAAV